MTELQRWALSDKDSDDIFVLVGDSGVGKSAIGQTFAEWCAEQDLLGASFFFSRACDVSYHRVHQMFPTIAYQLAEHIPSCRSSMNIVLREPVVIKSSIDIQLQKLIAEPLLPCKEVGNPRQIVVIDGLDELPGVPLLRRILALLRTHPTLLLRFLVTARTHSSAQSVLDLPRIRCLRLEGSFAADEQIRIYLQAELQKKIPLLMSKHPSAIDTLLRRSSGQFIYASALIQFLSDETHDANERLERIISWEDVPAGSSELDRLYLHILSGVGDELLLTQILGLLVWCPCHIEAFSKLIDKPPPDVILFLRNVRPVIHLPDLKTVQLSDRIHIRHISFIDFLTDKTRVSSFLDESMFYVMTTSRHQLTLVLTGKLSYLHVMKISKFSFVGFIQKTISKIKAMPPEPPHTSHRSKTFAKVYN